MTEDKSKERLLIKNLTSTYLNPASPHFNNESYQVNFLISMLMMIELKDERTYSHSIKVGTLAGQMGEVLGFTSHDVHMLQVSGMLHDLGKLYIDNTLLKKTGTLSRQEFSAFLKHPALSANVLSVHAGFKDIANIVRWHHERYDGRGYPGRLSGEQIPILTRVISICDAWDAMTSKRPYKDPLPKEKALKVLKKESGKQFDPELAPLFIKNIDKIDID